MGCSRGTVSYHNEIRIQGLEIARGIFQRLAFFERRSFRGEVDDVCREPLFGQLEADSRTGRWLHKEIDDCLASKRGDLFDGALADCLESPRGIEHGDDLVRRERFNIQQMFARPAHKERDRWITGLMD